MGCVTTTTIATTTLVLTLSIKMGDGVSPASASLIVEDKVSRQLFLKLPPPSCTTDLFAMILTVLIYYY